MFFCKHKWKLIKVLYGDMIAWNFNKRQELQCIKCKKICYK